MRADFSEAMRLNHLKRDHHLSRRIVARPDIYLDGRQISKKERLSAPAQK